MRTSLARLSVLSVLSVFGVVGALTAPLATQQTRATIGRFLEADGSPVAGAEVTFATSPMRVYDTFEETTLTTTRTDDEGRFRARLRTGTAYSAWAVGPRTENGCMRSKVTEGVIAGNVIAFEAATNQDLTALRVNEAHRLGEGGPFTARIRLAARHGPELSLPIAADGTIALPPLPQANLHLRIYAADGRLRVASPSVIGASVWFGEAREYTFVVTDEKAQPIAEARVAFTATDYLGDGSEPFQQRRAWHGLVEAPPTDAEGRSRLTVHDHGIMFVAWAEGRALTLGGVLNGDWVENSKFVKKDANADGTVNWESELRFALQPAKKLTGRLHESGTPRRDVGIRYTTSLRIVDKQAFGEVSASVDHAESTRTDERGRFRFDVPLPASGTQIAIAPQQPGEPPILLQSRSTAPEQPIDIDLARWPVRTLRLLDATGGPPTDGRVVLLPAAEMPSAEPLALLTDRAGRAKARLEPREWLVFATDGESYHATVLDPLEPGSIDRELRLTPLAQMAGTLVDIDGNPVADARFNFGGRNIAGTPAPSRLEQLLRYYSARLNRGLLDGARTREDGTFDLRFLHLAGVTHSGNMSMVGSPRVLLQPGKDIELRLEK